MRFDKRWLITLGALVLLLVLLGLTTCQPHYEQWQAPATTAATEATLPSRTELRVGVCLPSQSEAWMIAGQTLRDQLKEMGYLLHLTGGDGTVQTQEALLLDLMDRGADCIVVAPVDSAALVNAAKAAQERQVPLICYGSLLTGSSAVAGYVCYDYYQMGVAVARQVEAEFSLAEATGEQVYTLELFMGSAEDYNALLLHSGILSVLQPYLDSGVLVSPSHRTAFEDSCIPQWSANNAQRACAGRLQGSYENAAPDICICASDSIATGVIRALEQAGIPEGDWPFVTGNGATAEGQANLAAGKQALTVATDPTEPPGLCCSMVDMVLLGLAPEFSPASTHNNTVDVPTALCDFRLIGSDGQEIP